MIRVLMLGPARSVKGGMTTVVDNYYLSGLQNLVDLKYIETCNDKNFISKILKEIIGFFTFIRHYKKYDVDKIYIYDNNDLVMEPVEEVINDYLVFLNNNYPEIAKYSLTEEELDLMRRGRNIKTQKSPKNCDTITYKRDTAFEILIGFLYKNDKKRLNEVFDRIINL